MTNDSPATGSGVLVTRLVHRAKIVNRKTALSSRDCLVRTKVDLTSSPTIKDRHRPHPAFLTIAKSGPTDLVLSWPVVVTDFDGRPTHVDHYEVYASFQPFTRASIRDGLVSLLQSVAVSSATITSPPAANQYYSVLAVDSRGNKSPF